MIIENNNYSVGDSGRIKAAGVTADPLFAVSDEFKRNPSLASAQSAADYFTSLRTNPPAAIRDRFFPRNRATRTMFRSGSLALRPMLKTDQGAGKFLPFESGDNNGNGLRFDVKEEHGYYIPELFFQRQLKERGYPAEVTGALEYVRANLHSGDLRSTQLAYENFQQICLQFGIQPTREADVGRVALFVIRPAIADKPASISVDAKARAEGEIAKLSSIFTQLAVDARDRFAREQGVTNQTTRVRLPIYFQADVQLLQEGTAIVDQIRLPDVGLFLTALDPGDNEALREVKKRVLPLRDQAIEAIARKVKRSKKGSLIIVTRPQVSENDEDVLEIMEIQVLQQELGKHEIKTQVISSRDITDLNTESMALLMNVDVHDGGFQRLLYMRLFDDSCAIYPDPFLLLAAEQMTGYHRRLLDERQVEGLTAIVKDVEANMPRARIYTKLLALDAFLTRLGFTDDIFHLRISSQAQPVPVFRYDLRGVQIAVNYIQPGDTVEIRAIPHRPDNAVLFDKDGSSLYSVFRFFVTEEDI